MTRTPLCAVWHAMRFRCRNPENAQYPDYGGRGVVMCDRYHDSLTEMLADLGDKPSPAHSTIDRQDNEGGYTCGKCDHCKRNGWAANLRWATRLEQARNKRNNVWLEFNGERLCMSEWGARLGVTAGHIQSRLKCGWSIEKTLTTPFGSRKGKRTA
jgi:hypothetical protein